MPDKPDDATPIPAKANVDTESTDAPPQQAERARRDPGGFSDTDGETTSLGGAGADGSGEF